MANEQKISKWWFWGVVALANLFLLVAYIVLMVPGVLDEFTHVRVPKPLYAASDAVMRLADVFGCLIYEPVRRAMGQGPHQFYSPFTILFIWELMAFAGGLLCYAVGLLCHNVAGKPRRAPNGEGQQPGDRGEAREPEKGGAGSGTEKETGGNE